jgi:hypothetical protein
VNGSGPQTIQAAHATAHPRTDSLSFGEGTSQPAHITLVEPPPGTVEALSLGAGSRTGSLDGQTPASLVNVAIPAQTTQQSVPTTIVVAAGPVKTDPHLSTFIPVQFTTAAKSATDIPTATRPTTPANPGAGTPTFIFVQFTRAGITPPTTEAAAIGGPATPVNETPTSLNVKPGTTPAADIPNSLKQSISVGAPLASPTTVNVTPEKSTSEAPSITTPGVQAGAALIPVSLHVDISPKTDVPVNDASTESIPVELQVTATQVPTVSSGSIPVVLQVTQIISTHADDNAPSANAEATPTPISLQVTAANSPGDEGAISTVAATLFVRDVEICTPIWLPESVTEVAITTEISGSLVTMTTMSTVSTIPKNSRISTHSTSKTPAPTILLDWPTTATLQSGGSRIYIYGGYTHGVCFWVGVWGVGLLAPWL